MAYFADGTFMGIGSVPRDSLRCSVRWMTDARCIGNWKDSAPSFSLLVKPNFLSCYRLTPIGASTFDLCLRVKAYSCSKFQKRRWSPDSGQTSCKMGRFSFPDAAGLSPGRSMEDRLLRTMGTEASPYLLPRHRLPLSKDRGSGECVAPDTGSRASHKPETGGAPRDPVRGCAQGDVGRRRVPLLSVDRMAEL